MKKLFPIILALAPLFAYAQYAGSQMTPDVSPFGHLQLAVSGGTTGVGMDLSSPINSHLRLRAGVSFLPHVTVTKAYKMTSVGAVGKGLSAEEQERRILNLCGYLGDMVNSKAVDPFVDMRHQVSFWHAKVLLDWYPFQSKHWHFTAGLYLGSKTIGRAINTEREGLTMVAVNMYNNMYDQIASLGEYEYPNFNWGKYSFEMDPSSGDQMKAAFNEYGRVAIHLGDFADGSPHYLTPDKDGVMQVEAEVSPFRPFVGGGYETALGKEQRWTFGFDAGVMVLTSSPHIYGNDGVCLTHDVAGTGGTIGRFIKIVRNTPVYPVLEVKLAYSIF